MSHIGIVGRAILAHLPQLIPDVTLDLDIYREIEEKTKSELVIPLIDSEKVLGAINIESDRINDFDKDDQAILVALAEMSVIILRNIQHHEEMTQAEGKVSRAAAIAWTSMASAAWRHTISGNATTIQDVIGLVRRDLIAGKTIDQIQTRLNLIDKMAANIRNTPITAPLSSEEGVGSVLIGDFIKERMNQLQRTRDLDSSMQFKLQGVSNNLTVRINPEWLRRALDILFDNALEAMRQTADGWLRVYIAPVNNGVEIAISDNGRGIPQDVQDKIFKGPIPKSPDAKGSGVGLLLAQMIFETFGGHIAVRATRPGSTTMVVWLPPEPKPKAIDKRLDPRHLLLIGQAEEANWFRVVKDISFMGKLDIVQEMQDIEQVLKHRYDLIIVDAKAVQSTADCIQRIRRCTIEAKIVVIAASLEWSVARAAFQAGAIDFISKSTSFQMLRTTLSRILKTESQPHPPQVVKRPAVSQGTILFADNDGDFLKTRKEFIEQAGYQVVTVSNPNEARQVLLTRHIDLAVLDIRLLDNDDDQDQSGLSLAREIDSAIPKIMLTAYTSIDVVRKTYGRWISDSAADIGFVLKSEGPEALLQAIEAKLKRPNALQPSLLS